MKSPRDQLGNGLNRDATVVPGHRQTSGSDELNPGAPSLVPRGERHRLLMFMAIACHVNGVEQAPILAILKLINSGCCHPPKRQADLEGIVGWACRKINFSSRSSNLDGNSLGLIPRGKRYHFLMLLAAACRENGVEQPSILAILKLANSEYCHPPKRELEVARIAECRISDIHCILADLNAPSRGFIPRGERHSFLTLLASTCREHGVKQAATLEVLRQANLSCDPPKREQELTKLVDRILRKPHTRRTVPLLYWMSRTYGAFITILSALRENTVIWASRFLNGIVTRFTDKVTDGSQKTEPLSTNKEGPLGQIPNPSPGLLGDKAATVNKPSRSYKRVRNEELANRIRSQLAAYQKKMLEKHGVDAIRQKYGSDIILDCAIYNRAGVGKSEYYRWRSGQLPEDSRTQKDIETVLASDDLPRVPPRRARGHS